MNTTQHIDTNAIIPFTEKRDGAYPEWAVAQVGEA